MKKLLALVLAAVMAFSLVACGGGSEAGGETEGPVTIEFWHSMGSSTGELVQEIVDEFNASQDEVIVNAIYQGDYNAAGTKLQAAVSGGNAPHVVQIEITRVGFYAEEGLLMDLAPFDEADDEFNAEDMYAGVMDFSWYDGKLVSLPNGRSCPVMYYNADALKAAGFEKAPETWDELRAASKAVCKDGSLGYGISLGDSWYYLAMMLTAGGQVYNEEGNGIGFAGEAGEKPLQLWLDMLADGSAFIPEGEDYASNSALRNAFMAGQCNIIMQSSAQYRGLADNSDFEVGVAYIPKLTNFAAIPGGSNLVAFEGMSDAEAEATWKFMKYMCSADVAGKYAAGTGYLPTSEAALNSDVYQAKLAEYPHLDVAVEQLEYFVEMPFDPSYVEVKDNVVGRQVQECIINGKTPADAVATMETETAAFYK
ncbi:MAG: ABC transporter substrate-binding protein [Oscillospiraceae bacterium]|nr:ABC transporter substrate-binding protein [Oscillospiraceae bacterium]